MGFRHVHIISTVFERNIFDITAVSVNVNYSSETYWQEERDSIFLFWFVDLVWIVYFCLVGT